MIFLVAAVITSTVAFGEEASLDVVYRQLYNLDFQGAYRTLAEWERAHPQDAMGPATDAAGCLYSEFDRLRILQSEFFVDNNSFFGMSRPAPDPAVKRRFDADLAKAQTLANAALARDPRDEHALLALILRSGLHSDYLALIEHKYIAALGEVKTTREIAERALAAHPDLYDAYIAIGEENYVLSQKPAALRWVLHMTGAQTDKETGIAKLRLCAEKGRYFAPYAKLLLAVADLRNNDIAQARQRLAALVTAFPNNRLYREELAKLRS